MAFHYTILLKFLLAILALSCTLTAVGQSWAWAQRFGGAGNISCDRMQADENGIYIAGSFQDSVFFDTQKLQAEGARDVYLTALDQEGNVRWTTAGSSIDDDDIGGMAINGAGDIYLAGSFWLSGLFANVKLTAQVGIRAIFLIKYNSDGQIQWGISISGTGAKQVNDIALDANGNILLTGFFQDSLLLPNRALVSMGERDAFVAKYDPNGQFLWAQQAGLEGNSRGVGLATDSENAVVVSGTFDRSIQFGDSLAFMANTSDNDVFVAKYDAAGSLLWAKKAGGVFEDRTAALATDAEDNIYLTGSFAGRLTLDSTLEILSVGNNDNFYLLRYTPDGAADWARSIGSLETEQATSLAIHSSTIVVGGYYRGSFEVDGLQLINPGDDFDGFVAGFSLDGQARWLEPILGNTVLLNTAVANAPEERVLVGGTFQGEALFDNQVLAAEAGFDIYVAELAEVVTPVREVGRSPNIRVYPNPTNDLIFIETDSEIMDIQVLDTFGRTVFTSQKMTSLSLAFLPKGIYFLQIKTAGAKMQVVRVVRQ